MSNIKLVPFGRLFFITLISSCFNIQYLTMVSASPAAKLLSSNQQSSSSSVPGSARSRNLQKQAIFNKPFGILNPSGCCPCNECCSCEPDYLDEEPVSPAAVPAPSLPGVPLFNRYGSSSSSSSSSTRKSLVVRRRYVRPNGALVVEVEEQPVANSRGGGGSGAGSSLFGGSGLFSRFLPSAIESSGSNRSQQIDPSEVSASLLTKAWFDEATNSTSPLRSSSPVALIENSQSNVKTNGRQIQRQNGDKTKVTDRNNTS